MINDTKGQTVTTDERILNAALRIFLEKGFGGATTRAIAAAAEINEVTLFRHYGNKLNLLKAVLEHFSPLADLEEFIQHRLGGNYREDLHLLATHILTGMTARPDILSFLMFEVRENPELPELLDNIPKEIVLLLAGFFQRYIEQGAIRPDFLPLLLAQLFFSQIVAFALSIQRITTHKVPMPLTTERAVEQLISVFLYGTVADPC